MDWITMIRSKTFWLGIGAIVAGIITIAKTGDITSGSERIVAGLGMIFVRDAVAKVNPRVE